jgi:SAM-dependent methyltransferase
MQKLKKLVKETPVIGSLTMKLIERTTRNFKFKGTASYWEDRYKKGGNSGAGSYNKLAEFKAEVINNVVDKNKLTTVVELGCGDGNQLTYAEYPKYTGFDISKTAIDICKSKFRNDSDKTFFTIDKIESDGINCYKSDLALSLDVIFHLVETHIYEQYMSNLFSLSDKYVIIYSSNYKRGQRHHERDHNFTKWVTDNKPNWRLVEKIDNRYKYDPEKPTETSKSDFYIFRRN